MTRQRLPSTEQQVAALKKKGVNIGRAKTKWTIYRLYNFYITQHHSKSMPVTYAYATSKKTFSSIEQSKTPEKVMVRTGTGQRISARVYVRRLANVQYKKMKKELPPNVALQHGRIYKTVDKNYSSGYFEISPPVTANIVTIEQARKRCENITDQLIDLIHIIQRNKGRFFQNYVVRGAVIAKGHNIVTPDGTKNPPIVVKFPATGLDRPDDYFRHAFMDLGFNDVLNVIYQYQQEPNASIRINAVSFEVVSQKRPGNIDRLRA